MSLSFLSPSRTVLMISDEALYIYAISAKSVKLVDTVPWSAENFEQNVALIISKDCGGKPILILNDMVEQHYRKEKIPNVSVMDKQNVVKRKLKVAFPSYPVRAALPLKEKVAKTDVSLGGSIYIFAAIPASEAFAKTMAAARLSLATVASFCLLPIEASDMIKKLSDKLANKNDKKAQWTIFIGQHKSGGLRQVVTRNGEIALTRMTPVIDNDDDPVVWANEVNSEFQATMSYLSRFGFDSSDGLNVILISESSAGDIVNDLIDVECDFHSISVDEAASILGLSIGVQETDRHADALHAAWIGRKSRFILPMKAKQIDNVSKPRQVATLLTLVLFFGGAFQAYQLMGNYEKIVELSDDIEISTHKKAQLDLNYNVEVKRKEALGYDIQLIQTSLSLYEGFENENIKALPLFYNIGLSLGRDLRIDRLELSHASKGITSILGGDKKIPDYVANMQMTFPSTTNAERGNAQVKDLQARLQMKLPDNVVKVTKLLEDYEYSEEIVVETGDVEDKSISQDYVAEISIEGPLR